MATITLGTKSLNDATSDEWDAAFDRQDPVLTLNDLEEGCEACNPTDDEVDDLGLDQDIDSEIDVQHITLTADQLLMTSIKEMFDRSKTYDSPGGERSMAKTIAMFNAMAGTELSVSQGWKFMALLKLVRSEQGFRLDSFIDGSAYFALAGESASIDAMKDGNI